MLAEPASMKLRFMKDPATAAIPTNAPRMSPSPTAVSPNAMTLPMTPWALVSMSSWMKPRYQSYVMSGLAGAAGIAAIRCQKARIPEPS